MNTESMSLKMPSSRRRFLLTLKKYGYVIAVMPLVFPWLFYELGQSTGWVNLFAWGVPLFVYVAVPILDIIIGTDSLNPDEEADVPGMNREWFYRLMTLVWVPAFAVVLFWSMTVLASGVFNVFGMIGWIASIGTLGGLGISVAHEMIHKDEKLETLAGGLLLSMVTYAGFKVEHLRGHHVNVSTPEDASSARFNQTLYSFLPHAWKWNFLNAWKLEAKRLEKKGLPAFHWRNELIWWYSVSAALLVTFTVMYGWLGAVFFIAQSFVALNMLEVINYVEHYGLHRRKLENGRYERTRPEHSWNSNYYLTNVFLFQVQRHSDHHASAKRRYQILRHFEEVPQLPAGYATMFVLAFFPPLWKKVMNPRVEAFYAGEEHQLS